MITSTPNRTEVKQILQLLNNETEISEEEIDEALKNGMCFVQLTESEYNDIFQERKVYDKVKS